MDYVFQQEEEDISRCLQCGTIIEYGGRLGKKFCSPNCKNRYHNYRRSRRKDIAQRSVMGILEKNYEVLDKLLMMDVKSMDRINLAFMGFNPAYATSYMRMGRRNVYTCFDISYELTPTRVKKISIMETEEPTSGLAP